MCVCVCVCTLAQDIFFYLKRIGENCYWKYIYIRRNTE